jgi:choline dehydrogenase-like flavoprotein
MDIEMSVIDSSAFAGGDVLPDSLKCDICIIGTGPAGATIARELSNTNLRITILESGGTERQPEADALNEIENVGWPRVMDQWLVRNRIMGGSSYTWGGRCAPFDEIDLEYRDWVPYSGWPLKAGDLVPYYTRGAKHLGLGPNSELSDDRIWKVIGHKRPNLKLDEKKLSPMFWQLSRDPRRGTDRVRFGRHLANDIGRNVTLVTNATVLRINVNDSGTAVESVEFATPGGRRWSLPTPTVALCTGAIENARILLSSDNVETQGVGNRNDLVGRFLMDHPRANVARMTVAQGRALGRAFGMYRSRAVGHNRYHYGVRLSPELQSAEQLPNCSMHITAFKDGTDDQPWESLKRWAAREANIRQDILPVIANAGLAVTGLIDYFILQKGLRHKVDAFGLQVMCEQFPNPDSRITLSASRDPFGMKISRIDWRISEVEALATRRLTELMLEQMTLMGLELPVVDEWIRDGAMFPRDIARDMAHPIGTTRMADDPTRGVVDAKCEVHGVDGLFVSGTSVFPTAGHANPTQLIVAMAVRLADTLKARGAVRHLPSAVSSCLPCRLRPQSGGSNLGQQCQTTGAGDGCHWQDRTLRRG